MYQKPFFYVLNPFFVVSFLQKISRRKLSSAQVRSTIFYGIMNDSSIKKKTFTYLECFLMYQNHNIGRRKRSYTGYIRDVVYCILVGITLTQGRIGGTLLFSGIRSPTDPKGPSFGPLVLFMKSIFGRQTHKLFCVCRLF